MAGNEGTGDWSRAEEVRGVPISAKRSPASARAAGNAPKREMTGA